uniref:UvrD-like helicase ATP-binding domain-containing protein n=1 Tax=Spongospora subterranea TaxID=70186 RepID=A0A0H5QN48_9EUKA|eukprot:CRZ02972.1 hypothetical protein [Spongospora subterranea]
MIRSLRYSFTAEQTSAITHPARVLLVYGGPNSGKTTVIAGRIAHHITESTCRPDQVLAFMPSSRTASALQSTIGNIFGNSSIHRDCNIQTYHSLAIDILKSYRAEAGLSETFRVLSPAEEAVFLHNRIKEIQAPEKYRLPRAHSSLIRLFSTIHKERISIERLRLSSPDIASMFCSFQNLKSEASVLTYDDVIDRVIELMLNEKAISEIISSSYCSIFIDSLQEMNNALLQFLGQIIKPSTAQITATVDPNRFVKSYYYGSTDPIASFRRLFPVTDQAYLTSSFTCPKVCASYISYLKCSLTSTANHVRCRAVDW